VGTATSAGDPGRHRVSEDDEHADQHTDEDHEETIPIGAPDGGPQQTDGNEITMTTATPAERRKSRLIARKYNAARIPMVTAPMSTTMSKYSATRNAWTPNTHWYSKPG
jgi:hypothetical protein